ncbi:hypothetical protein LAV79_02145 [Peribacillus butanolivorans]|uniref:hypothetical protein n=1 Tax=Peribacillus butanolivorans TaxID=421767 RepID=UPI0030C91FAE
MRLWKDTMKRKISLDILAGGNGLNLTGKEISAGINLAVMMESDKRGEVVIHIPYLSKDK